MASCDTKVYDHYKSMSSFEVVLEDARMGAENDWEEKFVADALDKYKKWGMAMFWSDTQDKTLRRIAGPDDY